MGKIRQDMHGVENQQSIDSKRNIDQKVMEEVEQQMGFVPNPLKIMTMRPGTVKAFMDYRNQIMEGGPLNEKEQSLIAIATGVALKSAFCIRTHSKRARNAGASDDEIVQTMLIAGFMSGTSPLHVAYGGASNE